MTSKNKPDELPEGVEFADAAPKLSEALDLPEGVEFAEPAPAPKAPQRGILATLGDMGKTALANAYDTVSMGLAPDLEDSRQSAITAGVGGGGPPPGALKAQFLEDRDEGAVRNPYSAAVGNIAGFVAGAGTAGIPKALGLAGKVGGGFLKQRLARAGVGGLFGGATSGLQTLASTHDPEKAWDAAKQGAGWGAAAMGLPEVTAPVMGIKGAVTKDPVERAALLTNAGLLGGTTYAGKARHLGKPLEYAGQSARDAQTIKLIRELLPKETAEVNARNALGEEAVGARNKAAETKVKDIFKEHLRARSPINRPAEIVEDPSIAVAARNKAAESKVKDIFREHRKAKSSLSNAPSGAEVPSIPGQPDLQAQALGKLGAKVQENFRFLRSKEGLGLKLNPEAEAGAGAILPDYEAQANAELGQFAGGKEAVLKRIMAELMAEQPKPTPPAKPPLPQNMGFPMGFGGLKLNPTAGFTPEPMPTAAPKPALPRNMGFDVGFEGIKLNPKAGFTPEVFTPEPLPTAESIAPKAAEGVNTRLLQMRQDQGIPSRIAKPAVKGFLNPLSGRTFFGAAEALVKDPVLATSVTEPVGKVLSKVGAAGDRYSKFLAGATGPLLQKKLEFLMRTDPEFRAQVEASNEQ